VLDQCDRPPFCPREGSIDKCPLQAQFSARQQVLAKRPQDPVQYPGPLPLLKTAVTALIGTIARGKIFPRGAGAQNPNNTIQHAPRIAPATTTTIRPLPNFLIPLNERLHVLPLCFIQIGHDFLQPILTTRKGLLAGYIDEMF
jgi:hypothetical protein